VELYLRTNGEDRDDVTTWLGGDKDVFEVSLRKTDRRAVLRAKTAARRIEAVRSGRENERAWHGEGEKEDRQRGVRNPRGIACRG
jgi:hypothetical protein